MAQDDKEEKATELEGNTTATEGKPTRYDPHILIKERREV